MRSITFMCWHKLKQYQPPVFYCLFHAIRCIKRIFILNVCNSGVLWQAKSFTCASKLHTYAIRPFPHNMSCSERNAEDIALYYKMPNTNISARNVPRGLCLTQHAHIHTTRTPTFVSCLIGLA